MALCLCDASEIMALPCSGAANCGQIANELALRLRDDGKATPYCTVGIGGHVKGIVEGARSARLLLAIDGCNVGCARKCLEGEGLGPGMHFIVADEIKMKKDHVRAKEGDIRKAYELLVGNLDAVTGK
jgi:uncharacterized metal-binding protein